MHWLNKGHRVREKRKERKFEEMTWEILWKGFPFVGGETTVGEMGDRVTVVSRGPLDDDGLPVGAG